jgi:hypothetical protein
VSPFPSNQEEETRLKPHFNSNGSRIETKYGSFLGVDSRGSFDEGIYCRELITMAFGCDVSWDFEGMSGYGNSL